VNSMPIGDMFLSLMYRSWEAQARRQREVLSPKYGFLTFLLRSDLSFCVSFNRSVLGTLGQKYDQYLDFAQQDAHEFLRIILDAMRMEEQDIIKKRQPPPPKKRRRTTLTPADPRVPLSSAPPPSPIINEEDKLISFVDMIFGGQLTSILVCQKCKHISQTYEDFNDISLSIKPEDYAHRKRDRLKNFAKRLTTFPSSSSASNSAKPLSTISSIQRPSSVPPTPSSREQREVLSVETHDDATRRRSLDLPAEEGEDADTPSPVTSKEEEADSDNSHVLVNATGPEDKHVEFVDVQRGKKDKGEKKEEKKEKEKKGDDGWAKLGRRISLTVGLGKPRDRKSRSMERMGTLEDEVVTSTTKSTTSWPSTSALSSLTFKTEPSPPEIQVSPPTAKPSSSTTTPNTNPTTTAPRFPNVQRSKSPKPPKPTAAETEYLRKILADVGSGPPNPFNALFKPIPHPHLHHHPHHAGPSIGAGVGVGRSSSFGGGRSLSTGGPGGSAQGVWLGMSQFSGIEDCLRMFTAVEVLDGENMVGCRRCWKIANGVDVKGNGLRDGDGEEEESGDEGVGSGSGGQQVEKEVVQQQVAREETKVEVPEDPTTAKIVHQKRTLKHALPPLSPPSVHIPTSMSTPTVMFYNHLNPSGVDSQRSISSLPNTTDDVASSTDDAMTSTDDATDVASSAATSVEYLELKSEESIGPGGMPIPSIQTTAPLDGTTALISPPDALTRSSSASSAYSTGTLATSNGPLSNYPMSNGVVVSPSPRIGSIYQNQAIVSSGSLPIPPVQRHPNRRKDTFNNATDEDESSGSGDESEGSVSGDSFISPSSTPPEEMGSRQQLTASTSSNLSPSPPATTQPPGQQPAPPTITKKLPRPPKPVIMRPAYKRYLIATPPPVLVVHLKRFQQIAKTHLISFSHGFKKLDDYVTFPEYLDLTPFLAPRKEDYGLGKRRKDRADGEKGGKRGKGEERCMYRLYAVVVHIGNMVRPFLSFSWDKQWANVMVYYIAWRPLRVVHCAPFSIARSGFTKTDGVYY
jgi:ubiquitin C-terminal hydrolase